MPRDPGRARPSAAPAPEAAIAVGAGSGADRADAGGAARAAGEFRRLRAEIHRHAAGICRRQSAGAHHVRRRGARPRGGHRGPAVRRTFGQIAGPDDRGDRARPQQAPTSPTSFPGGRPATARRRRRRRRSACRSSSARSNWSIPDVLVTLGNPSTQTLLATREGIMEPAASGSTTTPAPGRSARSPPSIRPICCARRPTSAWRGRICARSRRRWRQRPHPEPQRRPNTATWP